MRTWQSWVVGGVIVSLSGTALAQDLPVVPGAGGQPQAPATTPPPVLLPPDIVRLKSGAFVRGAILDHDPSTRTAIQTDTGRRVFEAAEIVYAGPTGRDPLAGAAVAAAPPATPMLEPLIELRSTTPQVQFFLWSGTSTVTVHGESDWGSRMGGSYTAKGVGHSFRPLCTAPCSVRLQEGSYRIGLARRGERPTLLDGDVQVRAGVPLQAEFTSDPRSRALPIGLVTGGVLALVAGTVFGLEAVSEGGDGEVVLPAVLLAGGLVSTAVGGFLLPRDPDKARIRPLLPGASRAPASLGPRAVAIPKAIGPSFGGSF